MIHYGELSTKGDNKRAFIRQLLHNIKDALNNDQLGYRSNRDHIFIALNGVDPQGLLSRLEEIAGIQRISLVYKGSKDIEAAKAEALDLIKGEAGKTFKIEAKRADKNLPFR
jgi:thiamine biosynthesis protein ThiI